MVIMLGQPQLVCSFDHQSQLLAFPLNVNDWLEKRLDEAEVLERG